MVAGSEFKGLTDCNEVGATALVENFLILDDLVKLLYGTTACAGGKLGGASKQYHYLYRES